MNRLLFTLFASILCFNVSANTIEEKEQEQPQMTGIYIISGSGYCYQTGQYTMDSGSRQLKIDVYKDEIVVYDLSVSANFGQPCKYAGTSGRTKYYRDWAGGLYYLRMDGSMYYETSYMGLTFMYEMTRVH